MVSLVFIFGGVAPKDLFLAALVIWATAITFGMIGLFFSAWRKRTIQAVVLSYLVILGLIIGTYVIYIFWGVLTQNFPPRAVLVVNPFSALASVLAGGGYQAGVSSLFAILAGWGPVMVNGDFSSIQGIRPLWHYTLAVDLVLSTGLYLLATRFIKPIRPWRMHKRAILILAVIALLYGLGGGVIFASDLWSFVSPVPLPPTSTPIPPIILN
jgi:ABC-type transport system involved in multi-copper enzyme maturation permease subunit